jgi:hypothetical protein
MNHSITSFTIDGMKTPIWKYVLLLEWCLIHYNDGMKTPIWKYVLTLCRYADFYQVSTDSEYFRNLLRNPVVQDAVMIGGKTSAFTKHAYEKKKKTTQCPKQNYYNASMKNPRYKRNHR